MSSFGTNLKKFRKEKKWSQEQLARKLKVKRSRISMWECGQHQPSIEVYARICRVLNISDPISFVEESRQAS